MTAKDSKEIKQVEDRKVLIQEVRKLQTQVTELNNLTIKQKKKLAISKDRELALMQTNRTLVDMVKSYADREALVLTSWRTMQQTFRDTINLD